MKTAKPSSRRRVRKASLKPSQLNGYLAGAAGTAAMFGAPQAEAAVTAVTFGFGSEYTASDGYPQLWPVGSFGGLYGGAEGSYLNLGRSLIGFGSVYHTASQNSIYGRAKFFANGTVIGGGGNGALGVGSFQSSNSNIDFTTDQTNMNIGFKTSSGNWGWANVSWTELTKTLAINSAFVESVAGNTITIPGAVPEPSRALLALAGLGAATLRRRRKLAA